MMKNDAKKNQHKARAKKLINSRLSLGVSREIASSKNQIASVGTARNYAECVSNYFLWMEFQGISKSDQDHKSNIVSYLEDASEIFSQSTLDQHRQALQLVFQSGPVKRIRSKRQSEYGSRSYSWSEVKNIALHQSERNRISTYVAYSSGIRAHELATLRRVDEMGRSPRRPWRDDLFDGLGESKIYVVTGKGGLRRCIALPEYLAQELEKFRCPERIVRDRGISYRSVYMIGFGQSFSQSFSRASKAALGRSTGAHGLRHSYLKRRMRMLLDLDYSFKEACSIISQEAGHFRPGITTCYLR
jgi:integrase